VKLRKSLCLQIYYVLGALPAPPFGDNTLHQSKRRAKGNSEGSHKLRARAGASGCRCPSPTARAPRGTRRLIQTPPPSGVTLPLQQDGVPGSPPLGPPGWTGTSPRHRWAGRMPSGFTYLPVASKIICNMQLSTKRSPWVGGERVPGCSPSHARTSPLRSRKIGLFLRVM